MTSVNPVSNQIQSSLMVSETCDQLGRDGVDANYAAYWLSRGAA